MGQPGLKDSSFKNPVIRWIDRRLPVFSLLEKEYGKFPTPKNFNYLWNFGALALVMLVVMILSGVFLAMQYTPHADMAFNSVERIMRDVNYGWLLRYLHANGASMFFIVVYVHIFRGLYYGSYKTPRELLWILGVVILLLMMATAFMGYVLPWGQMSFWGATVITNLFSAFPLVGGDIVTWLWGGFSVDNPTLNRFFALHYLLPFVIFAVVFLHVAALHITGSNNPTGVEPQSKDDTIPFHPYYTVKDSFGMVVFFIFYAYFVFFQPNYFGHPDNYIPANPMVTPAHIVPEWYFLPFYAILRAVPDKLGGVILMFAAVLILMFLPWLDTSKVRSMVYRPMARVFFWLLVVASLVLGYVGSQPPEEPFVTIGRLATTYYFGYFLIVLPLLGRVEKTLPLPRSISEAVKKKALPMILLGLLCAMPLTARASGGGAVALPDVAWSFDGHTGTYDRGALQRGYQVYKEVCAACHSLQQVHYRDLSKIGFSEDEIKVLAAQATIMDGPNDAGEMFERPRKPSDVFAAPYANDQAARASNNGALPPDLSLITKARANGANYLYAILTGYHDAPADMVMADGMSYNLYFAGHQIAMPAPLSEGSVTYADGTPSSVDQMARDVTTFLTWAAEPEMDVRKAMGVRVILFLSLLAVLFYLSKKRVWAKLKLKK